MNEEKVLIKENNYYQQLSRSASIIFADGGSSDRTTDLCARFGKVLLSPKGRARQKNMAAESAQAKYLLFLHVDTKINLNALVGIIDCLEKGVICGSMTMKIDDHRFIFRIYENIVNYRARSLGIIDGDLGLFVRKDIFKQLGGFDNVAIMDDIAFSKKLRTIARLQILDESIIVSSRKWDEKGFLRTFWGYSLAYCQHWTGIPFYKHADICDS